MPYLIRFYFFQTTNWSRWWLCHHTHPTVMHPKAQRFKWKLCFLCCPVHTTRTAWQKERDIPVGLAPELFCMISSFLKRHWPKLVNCWQIFSDNTKILQKILALQFVMTHRSIFSEYPNCARIFQHTVFDFLRRTTLSSKTRICRLHNVWSRSQHAFAYTHRNHTWGSIQVYALAAFVQYDTTLRNMSKVAGAQGANCSVASITSVSFAYFKLSL
jgi:hypothetical protein